MRFSANELEKARRLLCRLQDAIRDELARSRRPAASLRRVAGVTSADTIYGIDRVSEETVVSWFEKNWPRQRPVELVMEGLEDGVSVTFPRGTPVSDTLWKCILDPIDGTRSLMYDKRSGWSLAGLAPQRGAATTVSDIVVAVMTELPTSKSGVADQLSAVRGAGLRASRLDLRTRRRVKLDLKPSTAKDLAHGFASFVKFFPADKAWLAEMEEKLWRDTESGAAVFDDQYLSTGGQLYELIAGHDRFIADLRPLAPGGDSALCCHPYDICTALIATEAGCVITSPDGKPLDVPLDTTTPVAWVGYANKTLARRLGAPLRRLLQSRG